MAGHHASRPPLSRRHPRVVRVRVSEGLAITVSGRGALPNGASGRHSPDDPRPCAGERGCGAEERTPGRAHTLQAGRTPQ